MHTTNYRDTLILPSPDCAAAEATAPTKPGTIAALQHERLVAAPYTITSDDLLFGIHADRKEIAEEERGPARMEFFSKGQACLRASPLVKTLGWALHHDSDGRVALVDPDSSRFAQLQAQEGITKLVGMRSKKA
ncbi:DUF6157 family protein [Devosia aurantiaca]|uniref:Uncharacterized protein n=1 Tax=Devosia aurantiaca TaxID=2714858 RepID=A0A6M1SID8_9HYPH|nr:DUF6157 family protein [Devosia aurantiaca]NGP16296.1 hypothetical protein [Devosia aurantiaca]